MAGKAKQPRIQQEHLGIRQQMIMKSLWKLGGEATIPAISARMQEDYGSSLTGQAMNTMLLLMTDKGIVERGDRKSHAFLYRATITEQEYRDRDVARSCSFTFDGSASELLASLLKTGVDEKELKKIRALIRNYGKE